MRLSTRIAMALLGGLAGAGLVAWAGPEAAPTTAPAGSPAAAISKAHLQKANELIANGVKFLMSKREADGGWSMGGGAAKPAITAMVLKALVQDPAYGAGHPAVVRGFAVLLSYQRPDGGIYDAKEGQENYTTAVALMALASARQEQYKPAIEKAIKYLKGLQIVPGSTSPDGQEITDKDPRVGGVSYGQHGRPDLSNVGMWMDALHEAGVSGEDPAMQQALIFVTRTQNRSESNPLAWAQVGVNDGGFIYAPAVKGDLKVGASAAGPEVAGRGLRSYGSMTYTGFKSLLYAAVGRQDPRVQAAFKWIQKYWRLDANPNMPEVSSKQGLFYYYHVFAKALRAWGEPVITDADGRKHNWREEIIDELAKRVKPDGSWEGDRRWYEADPTLSTCYAVLALQEALAK